MHRRLGIRALATLALATTAASAGPPARPQVLPVADVRPGMEVTAWTIFAGDTIEPFHGRVVGVARGFRGPGRDVVLVEFLGERLRHTGIVHGMSGSPVYIGDRLLGALSLVLSPFPKDPIGGVTPFESMQADGLIDGGAPAHNRPHTEPPGLLPGDALLQPLAPPLVVSGLPPAALALLRPALEAVGLRSVQAVGGAVGTAASDGPERLVAGAAAAAVLARGDASIAATGTITYRDGDRLSAFGHPFLGLGRVEFGLAPADIITTLADQTYSYKIANVGPIVGSVVLDRISGVTGLIGRTPRLVPLAVSVRAGDHSLASDRYEVIDDRRLTPVLVQLLTLGSLTGRRGYDLEATFHLRGRIQLADGLAVPLADAWTVASHPDSDAAITPIIELGMTLTELYLNPFERPRVIAIELEFELTDAAIETLETIQVMTAPVAAGRETRARLVLRRQTGERRTLDVAIPIPRWAAGRALVVRVADKETLIMEASSIGSIADRTSRLAQLVTALGERARGDRIHVQLLGQGPGAAIRHHDAGSLPSSVERVLARDLGAYRQLPRRVLWQRTFPTDGTFVGVAEQTLEVRR